MSADALQHVFTTEKHPLLTRLPGALCLIKQDPYLTLLWANDAFFTLMNCSEDEMGYRFAHRVSALWDSDGVELLARFAREAADGDSMRFRHHLSSADAVCVLETEAVVLADEGLLCCMSRDCSREALGEMHLEQFQALGRFAADTAGFEVFAYNCANKSARVLFASDVLGQLPSDRSVYENFPEVLIQAGLVHPEDEHLVRGAFDLSSEPGARTACDARLGGCAPDTGRWRWYRFALAGCETMAHPDCASGFGVLQDITEHVELTMSYLNDTQFYYALLSEKDAYAHVDVTDDVLLKIGGMWNLYNEVIDTMSYTDVVRTFIERVVHPDDRAHYLDIMRCENFISSLANGIEHLGCEFRRIVEQNKMAWMELSVHLLKDPTTQHVLALLSIKNIDKKKRQELQLQNESERDPLTQVLHKKAVEAAVRARLDGLGPRDASALIILDIDDFKAINDSWGHKVGDQALMRFMHEVRCSVGKDDVLGRFGGDEFVLFLAKAFDEEHVSKLLGNLFDRLALEGDPVLRCSAGVALMPYGMPYNEGFRRADEALYRAKAAGKATFRFYREADGDDGDVDSVPTLSYEHRDHAIASAQEAGACGEGSDAANSSKDAGLKHFGATPALPTAAPQESASFAEFLSAYGEIAYLVDPDTFTLICGNEAFYERIGETPFSCMGMKCYEAMQGRTTPCPFCSKANWTTDKFFMWRNDNQALNQEFLIKNKLVMWEGREVLLAIAVDVSNDKSIVDSLDNGISEGHYLLGGIQQMNAARDLGEVIDCALETIGRFFRAKGVRFWAKGHRDEQYKCRVAWSRNPGSFVPLVPDDHSLDAWLGSQRWDEPVMVESPEVVLRSSYSMYRYMKDNGVTNQRWIRLRDDVDDKMAAYYIVVENLGANLQNVAFLESFSVFIESEIGRRRMMDDLIRAGSHDDLTGLLNRECYERTIALFDSDRPQSVGVVSANVNGMKAINSAKGFAAGNYYLQQFATMLLDMFPPECVYRLNGDEFAVIVQDIDREALEARMRELRGLVESNGLFTVALGYSWDEVEKDLDVLTGQALRAMEAEKRRRHDMAQEYVDDDRRTTLRNLVASISDGKFLVYFQPKVRLSDGKLVGAEALVRYRDPELGVVAPARFIQGLEDSGLVRHVDLFVFESVCQVVERWEREGVAVPVSFNLSRRTLLENDLVASMQSIVARHDLDRRNLEAEITESFAAIGKSVLYQAAHDLLDAGFSLSLDDFGTKYTDLSILSSIGFSMIKLDRSLMESVVDDPTKQTVLKHIIGMCEELHVNVIAEGVETPDQELVLSELGCRYGQGYLYGRPVPLDEFERAFIRQGR